MEQTDWLSDILNNVQLEQFYVPIRDQLQVTRLAHFDYVHSDDLEKIGISKPGVRRLLEAVKKKKLQQWRRNLWNKLLGSSHTSGSRDIITSLTPSKATGGESGLTCLILEKNILLQERLGTGSFGVVKKGEWKSSGAANKGLPVAVKVLKADALSQPGVFNDFVHEVEAMHSLSHPNLIRLHGVVFHPLMMVCELAPMGALLDYIRAQNGKVPLNLIWKWSEQVAAGMAYLEKNRLLHRDLACRNILLSTLDIVKIGDFGLTRVLPATDDCYVMSESRRVPFPWCAPESLHNKQFSHSSDVWMFAVALWEMYTFGEDPWMGLGGSEILRLIMREGQRLAAPAACPPDVYMLMMQCWDLSPKERPTFMEIVRYLDMNKLQSASSSLSYRKQGQMTIEAGDSIILIDKRPELHWWKGQNQRTLEVGLFPSALVNVLRNKNALAPRKSQTLSPSRKEIAELNASPCGEEAGGGSEAGGVVLRKKKTLEWRQPPSTRARNSGGRQFNYNKLVNQRAADHLHSHSLRWENLIDLDLPPPTLSSASKVPPTVNQTKCILDEPIDVPQAFPENEQPNDNGATSYGNTVPSHQPDYSSLQGARSLDCLPVLDKCAPHTPAHTAHDPFDTSHIWPVSPPSARPNYEFSSNFNTQPDSMRQYATHQTDVRPRPNYDLSSLIPTQFDATQPTLRSPQNNVRQHYEAECSMGNRNNSTYTRPKTNYELTLLGTDRSEQNHYNNIDRFSMSHYSQSTSNNLVPENVNSSQSANTSMIQDTSVSLPEAVYGNGTMSCDNLSSSANDLVLAKLFLDDKISESLNLKVKPVSGLLENIYSNEPAAKVASETQEKLHSIQPLGSDSSKYRNELPSTYPYTEVSPRQDEFIVGTPDYYTKVSTTAGPNNEKNIYVPSPYDNTDKLKDFSGSIGSTKNFPIASEYEYAYTNSYGSAEASTSRAPAPYDPVYSEIPSTGEPTYNNVRLYDEVYESSVRRPHRPAPPAPAAPSPRPK